MRTQTFRSGLTHPAPTALVCEKDKNRIKPLDIYKPISHNYVSMKQYSTRQVAKILGIGHSTLAHYVDEGKLPAPGHIFTGERRVHVWTEEDIEQVRQLLPKIANGRKTRYQKLRAKQKAQPRTAVPHESRKPKKK
jgi:predicted DNA-binding transcriptional regulator AlpA